MKNGMFEASDFDGMGSLKFIAGRANTLLAERDKKRDAELKVRWLAEFKGVIEKEYGREQDAVFTRLVYGKD